MFIKTGGIVRPGIRSVVIHTLGTLLPVISLASASHVQARSCTPAEWQADQAWSQKECTDNKAKPERQVSNTRTTVSAPVPSRAEVGSDRWGREIGDTLKLINASIETGDRAELRKQGYRASRLTGEVGGWPGHDAWRIPRAHCVRVAQSLMNYVSDVEKGTARGLVSARAEMAIVEAASPKCAAALNRLK